MDGGDDRVGSAVKSIPTMRLACSLTDLGLIRAADPRSSVHPLRFFPPARLRPRRGVPLGSVAGMAAFNAPSKANYI
jgi:hypothetical protein